MIKSYNIQTKISPEQLATVVRLFYKGLSDTEIAEQLGDRALNKTVSRARIKLHLFRESDLKPPFDKAEFMRLVDEGRSVKELAESLGVAPSTISEYRNIFESQRAAERDGYVKRFEAILFKLSITPVEVVNQSDHYAFAIDRVACQIGHRSGSLTNLRRHRNRAVIKV